MNIHLCMYFHGYPSMYVFPWVPIYVCILMGTHFGLRTIVENICIFQHRLSMDHRIDTYYTISYFHGNSFLNTGGSFVPEMTCEQVLDILVN